MAWTKEQRLFLERYYVRMRAFQEFLDGHFAELKTRVAHIEDEMGWHPDAIANGNANPQLQAAAAAHAQEGRSRTRRRRTGTRRRRM